MDALDIDAFIYPGGFACLPRPAGKAGQQSLKQPPCMAALNDCAAPIPTCFWVPVCLAGGPTPHSLH